MAATDVSESSKWSGGKNLTSPAHVAGSRTAPSHFSGSIQAYLFSRSWPWPEMNMCDTASLFAQTIVSWRVYVQRHRGDG